MFSRRHGLELSVRSGGHSYTCTSLKHGGLHLDLRSLDRVELVRSRRSSTGIAAKAAVTSVARSRRLITILITIHSLSTDVYV